MTKQNTNTNYRALVKCINQDYPYCLSEYFDSTAPDRPVTDTQKKIFELFELCHEQIIKQHNQVESAFYRNEKQGFLDLKFLDHYLILCFRFANLLYKEKLETAADAVYYSSRVRTSSDFFYKACIGDYFFPVHPIGTLIDPHSTYGKGFRIYNGVHIGPYQTFGIKAKDMSHPQFGDGVILLANSSIYGSTIVGSNVIVSAQALIINEEIPDNCIVLGRSPDLRVIPNRHNNMGIINP